MSFSACKVLVERPVTGSVTMLPWEAKSKNSHSPQLQEIVSAVSLSMALAKASMKP
jgi:hypothetical protein